MYLSSQKIRHLAQKSGMTLAELLNRTGVSKTAYYHLTRKDSLLPKSVLSLAKTLGVKPSAFLMEENPAEQKVRRLRKELERILSMFGELDPENVWHALLLLEMSPWERLDRGLLRAQK